MEKLPTADNATHSTRWYLDLTRERARVTRRNARFASILTILCEALFLMAAPFSVSFGFQFISTHIDVAGTSSVVVYMMMIAVFYVVVSSVRYANDLVTLVCANLLLGVDPPRDLVPQILEEVTDAMRTVDYIENRLCTHGDAVALNAAAAQLLQHAWIAQGAAKPDPAHQGHSTEEREASEKTTQTQAQEQPSRRRMTRSTAALVPQS